LTTTHELEYASVTLLWQLIVEFGYLARREADLWCTVVRLYLDDLLGMG
jgi:hypothetical protein